VEIIETKIRKQFDVADYKPLLFFTHANWLCRYVMEFNEGFVVVASASFFTKECYPIALNKVNSIYAKIVFWAVETGNKSWCLDKTRKYYLDYMINMRNMKSHRNSDKNYGYLLAHIDDVRKGDDANYSYQLSILTRIRNSIINMASKSGSV
jgi:hypothetical protein